MEKTQEVAYSYRVIHYVDGRMEMIPETKGLTQNDIVNNMETVIKGINDMRLKAAINESIGDTFGKLAVAVVGINTKVDDLVAKLSPTEVDEEIKMNEE